MSNNICISIKDNASATSWLMNVVAINEQYHRAMKEAADTLTDMQNFADGTIVDDFVDLGSSMLTATESTFNAINSIADTVNKAIGIYDNFKEEISGFIGIAAKLLG